MRKCIEIKVTPFIDVMLELLIIYVVAATLATVDLGVDLPAYAVEAPPRPDKPVFVAVKPDPSDAVSEHAVARAALTATLEAAAIRMTVGRRKSWSERDDAELLSLKASGGTVKAIAKRLDRSTTSISSRLAHLKRERRLSELKQMQS